MQSALTQEYIVPHTDCLTIEIDRPRGSAADSVTGGKPANRKMSVVTKSEQCKKTAQWRDSWAVEASGWGIRYVKGFELSYDSLVIWEPPNPSTRRRRWGDTEGARGRR
jgi:hypothetical protein